jgi:hypothetical protein
MILNKTEKENILAICNERLSLSKDLKNVSWEIGANSCDGDIFKDIPERNEALLRGNYWDIVVKELNDSLVRRSSNLILPKINAKLSILGQGASEFFLEPTHPAYEDTIKDATGLLNYTWTTKQLDRIMMRLQLDTEKYGFGVAEVGWRFEREGIVLEGERGEPIAPETLPISPDVLAAYDSNPEFAQYETQAEAESMAMSMTKHEDDITWNTTFDDAFVRRVSPRNFWIDPNATNWDLSDARYVIKLEYVPLNKVKFNPSYDKSKKDVIGGVYSVREDLQDSLAINKNTRSDVALVKVYHCYGYFDVKENGRDEFLHIVFTKETELPLLVEKFTGRDDEPGYNFGTATPFPFRVLPGIVADNECPYPLSTVDQAADLQLSYDEASSQLNNLRRKSNRMYIVAKGSMDKDAIRKLEFGRDNSIIEVEPGLIDSLKPFPQQTTPVEVYKTMEDAPSEVQRAIGISEFNEGVTPQKNMTATETIAIQNSGNSRTNGCFEYLQDCKSDIAFCILCLYQQFADRDFIFNTKDDQGNRTFGSANAATLRGINPVSEELEPIGVQYKVKINVDSVNPTNRASKITEQLNLLTQLNPYITAGMIKRKPQ